MIMLTDTSAPRMANAAAYAGLMSALAEMCCRDQGVARRAFGPRCNYCPFFGRTTGCALLRRDGEAYASMATG
jgi:hypothetical protein